MREKIMTQATGTENTNNKNFKSGDLLFQEGSPGGDLWILVAGTVEVFQERNGYNFHLAQLKEGEILGAMTIVSGEPRTASVRAVTDVRVQIIKRDLLKNQLNDIPKWLKIVLKDLVSRVKECNRQIVNRELKLKSLNENVNTLAQAVSIAHTFLLIAEILQMIHKSSKGVSIEEASAYTAKSGRYELDQVKKMISNLLECKLLMSSEDSEIDVLKIYPVRVFCKMAATVIGDHQSNTYSMPFTKGERGMLLALAEFGYNYGEQVSQLFDDYDGETEEKVIEVSFSDISQHMKENTKFKCEAYTFDRCQQLDYLKIKKTNKSTIEFSPRRLEAIVRALELIIKITPPAKGVGSAVKGTLEY